MTHTKMAIASRLENKRIEMLYGQSIVTQSIGMLNAFLYWNITRDFMPVLKLNYWLAAVGLVFLARTVLQYFFHKRDTAIPLDAKLWEKLFIIGVLASGLLWGFAGSWLLPDGALAQHAFLGFLLSGTTAGVAVAYCTSIWSVQAFILPAVIPFAVAVFGDASKLHYCMSMLSLLYIGLITLLAVRLNRSLLSSVRYQYENENLLEEVRLAQSTVAQTAKMVALSEMSGGVAHEINTPLTIINFETQSIVDACAKNPEIESAVKPIASRIEAMVARIAKIVVGLKAFSREPGREQPTTLVSANSIIADTVDFCQGRIRNRGIALEIHNNVSDIKITCNNYKIIQALLNLVSNAIDAVANKTAGRIIITSGEDRDYVRFSVADNGHGIPTDIHDKIMQPFFTTKEVGSGTGLGLSAALGIAISHKGKIDFESSNKGSTFVLSLPREASSQAIAI